MDFKEMPDQNEVENAKKNKFTLLALAVVFVAPVLLAYLAYFNNWFDGGGRNKGELIEKPWHVDDLNVVKTTFGKWQDSKYMGKWNWLLLIDSNTCNEQCQINYLMLQQTHLGLAKNVEKNEYLLLLNQRRKQLSGDWKTIDVMQVAIENGKAVLNYSDIKGLNSLPIPANAIYLVDPLGNIFMRYQLVDTKEQAPMRSTELRSDINSIMRKLDVRKSQ